MKSKYLPIQIPFEVIFYVFILLVVLFFRYLVLLNFGFKYTDSDQSIIWAGLKNYAEGMFYEPRFYGQAYNTMLESLVAVPLYKAGLPIYKALPIITSFFTLFPYILISFFTFKKKSSLAALIILSIPLLLPIEYSLITSLSRGFVTGLFIASIGVVSIFFPQNKWGFFLIGFFSVLGYSVNANSILISLPCLLYLFLENRKHITFYLYCGTGLIIAGAIHILVNSFYTFNPFYNLHKLEFSFSFKLILDSFKNIDPFFNNVSPIFWNQGFIILPLFAIISVFLFIKRKSQLGLFFLSVLTLLILTFGISKVHNGTTSVFFPFSRMYLGIPILIGISISFVAKMKSRYYYIYFIIPLILSFYKTSHLSTSISQSVNSQNHVVRVAEVKYVLEECKTLATLCTQYNIDLVVIVNHYDYDILNYGCSACTEVFPKTLRPAYERRTWRLIEDENKVYQNILLIDTENALDEQFDFIEKIEGRRYNFLIQKNQLATIELLDEIGIDVREYK